MNKLLHVHSKRRFGSLGRLVGGLVLALGLGACASLEPPSFQPEPPAIPAAAPRATGGNTAGGPEHKRLVALFGGEYRAPAVERLLNDVLVKLAAASDSPGEAYRVSLLNSPTVNAFALPSGNLYVTRGLLALANDTSEIAAVMAHEIGHISARHAAQRAEHERNAALVSRVVSDVLEKPVEGRKIKALEQIRLASFSRQQELEADQIGVRTIARAGLDPYGASRFLTSLDRSTQLNASILGQRATNASDFLATHPATPDRIAQAISVARQYGTPGLRDGGRARYLEAVHSLAYGDNPAEGMIRGHNFLHPKLGFAIVAPEEFSLENSRNALLGVTPEGSAAMRLDSVKLNAATSLETYMASGWIEGLQAGSIETLPVNGLAAAVAIAKGKEWTFRFAAIRLGADVVRIIFATRSLNAETDARFRAAILSFHRLTREEAASVRPMHLELVVAGGSDSAASLAGRMIGTEKPLELFLLLNGLAGGETLKAGETYKIVTE